MKITNPGSPRHATQMRALAEFLDLDEIVYTDHHDLGEDYTLVRKDGENLTLRVRGNRDQGAFLCVECGLEPIAMT